jgi:hypothetical protein
LGLHCDCVPRSQQRPDSLLRVLDLGGTACVSAVCRETSALGLANCNRRQWGRQTAMQIHFLLHGWTSQTRRCWAKRDLRPYPATILNSTLLFPAIPKNAPCFVE